MARRLIEACARVATLNDSKWDWHGDEAIEYFRQVIRGDTSNVWAHINLGKALKHAGRFDEAADAS